MKHPICFMRTGSPTYFNNNAGARGDSDTVPLLNYLLDTYGSDNVVMFGPTRGEPPENLKHLVEVDTSRFDENTPNAEIQAALDEDVLKLAQYDCRFVIEMWGAPPTWSCPWNPNYARLMAFGVRYSLPMLYAMHRLKLERYGIVTDPKVYKRDLEMGNWWPECRPRAVLSQEQRRFSREIHGTQFDCHAVYAGCEFWMTRGMERLQEVPKEFDCGIAANTHIGKTGLANHDRRALWRDVLRHCPDGTALCGTGWENAFDSDEEAARFNYFGTLDTLSDVMDLLNRCCVGPMIPQYPGFNSTKPRLYALSNCVPLLYGDGSQEYTYDRDARIYDLKYEEARWPSYVNCAYLNTGDVLGHVPEWREEMISHVLNETKPNFSKLDMLIEQAQQGGYFDKGCDKTLWKKAFGGYYAKGE